MTTSPKRLYIFALLLIITGFIASHASAQTLPAYTDNFDGVTFPAMPAGWATGVGSFQTSNSNANTSPNSVRPFGDGSSETYQGLGSGSNWTCSINFRASSNAQGSFILRSDSGGANYYFLTVPLGGTTAIGISKRQAGTVTSLVTGTSSLTPTAGTYYTAWFQCSGTTIREAIRTLGASQPSTWDLTTTDGTFASGFPGLRGALNGGNYSNMDDIYVHNDDVQSVTASPLPSVATDTITVLTLTGTGTQWLTTAPTFAVSGVPGVTVSSVAASTNNLATATLTVLANSGTATLTDSTTGQSAPLVIAPKDRSDDYFENFDSAPTGAVPARWFQAGAAGPALVAAATPYSGANSIRVTATNADEIYNGFGKMSNATMHVKFRASSTSPSILHLKDDGNAFNFYSFTVPLAGSSGITIGKTVAGSTSTLSTGTTATSLTAGVFYYLDAQSAGPNLQMRIYPVNAAPPAWELTATDSSLPAGYPALSGIVVSANLPVFDDVEIRDDDISQAASVPAAALPAALTWGAKTYLARPNVPLAPALPQTVYSLAGSSLSPAVTTTGQPITITGGVGTITATSGQSSVSTGTFVWGNSQAVSQVHITANTGGIVRVGVASSAGVGYYAYYDQAAGTVGVMLKSGGTYTSLASSTAVPALPFTLECVISRDWVSCVCQGTGQHALKASASTDGVGTENWYTASVHGNYHEVLEYAQTTGTATFSFDNWTVGYFDNMGVDDCQWVTDESGNAFRRGGLLYFVADVPNLCPTTASQTAAPSGLHSGLFSYDPVTGLYSQVAQFAFTQTSGAFSGQVTDGCNPKVFYNRQDGCWYYFGGSLELTGNYAGLVKLPSDPTLGGIIAAGTPTELLPVNLPANVFHLYDCDILCYGGAWYVTGIYYQLIASVSYSSVALYQSPTLTGTYVFSGQGVNLPRREGSRFVQTARGPQIWAGARDGSGNAVYVDTYSLVPGAGGTLTDLGNLAITPPAGILMEHPATIRIYDKTGGYRYRMLGFDNTYYTYAAGTVPYSYGTLWTADTLEVQNTATLSAPITFSTSRQPSRGR